MTRKITFGRSVTNDAIDVKSLLERILLRPNNISRLRETLRKHPQYGEWEQLARDASASWVPEILGEPLYEVQHETADYLGVSPSEIKVADSLSMLAFTGMAHILEAHNFDIDNPGSLKELTQKLGAVRLPITTVGFKLIKMLPLKQAKDWNIYADAFLMGELLGYLTVDAHQSKPTLSPLFD
jgi:hypothetical protein